MITRALLTCTAALALSPVPAFPQGTPAKPAATAAPAPAVKIGQKAPDFTLPYLIAKPEGGVETREVSLAQFAGKQNVVLAFFPAAFSPG